MSYHFAHKGFQVHTVNACCRLVESFTVTRALTKSNFILDLVEGNLTASREFQQHKSTLGWESPAHFFIAQFCDCVLGLEKLLVWGRASLPTTAAPGLTLCFSGALSCSRCLLVSWASFWALWYYLPRSESMHKCFWVLPFPVKYFAAA